MAKKVKEGDVVLYEDRLCKVVHLTNDSVVLFNLERVDASDWETVTVKIKSIEN